MNHYLAIAGLVVVTIIWGGGFVASDMALESLLPFQIMAIRFFLGTVMMGAISIKGLKGIKKQEVKAGALMGAALFTAFALQIIGLQYTTPSKNAFLTALNVVMVPFIAFIICKKKIGVKGIIGAVMAVVGVGILSLEKNLTLGLGDALTLICAVGFAFQIFFYCFSVIFPLHNSSVICAHFFTDILFILSKFSLYFYVSSCTSARFDMMTAARMITHPITIRSVICSCRMMMENKVPNTDSIDKIIAAFVSSTCFWQAVCKR